MKGSSCQFSLRIVVSTTESEAFTPKIMKPSDSVLYFLIDYFYYTLLFYITYQTLFIIFPILHSKFKYKEFIKIIKSWTQIHVVSISLFPLSYQLTTCLSVMPSTKSLQQFLIMHQTSCWWIYCAYHLSLLLECVFISYLRRIGFLLWCVNPELLWKLFQPVQCQPQILQYSIVQTVNQSVNSQWLASCPCFLYWW